MQMEFRQHNPYGKERAVDVKTYMIDSLGL